MRRLLIAVLALVTVVLLADGTVVAAQEEASGGPSAESSPEASPEDGVVLAIGGRRSNGTGIVRLYVDEDQSNTFERRIDEFAPYTNPIQGGVRVALGDFDGDNNDELVTATGSNAPIRIFDVLPDGRHGAQLASFAGLPQGSQIATGDLNGDGIDELVIAADHGSSAVRIRSDTTNSGLPLTVTDSFNAYPQLRGVRVTLGDTDNNNDAELITAQGPGVAGKVKIWDDSDLDRAVSDNGIADSFYPFDSTYSGGTNVAAAFPQNGPTSAVSVVVAPESGRKRLRRFVDTDNDDDLSDDGVVEQFFPYGSTYSGGVRVAAGDIDRSGTFQELIVGPTTTTGTKPVRTINDDGMYPNQYSTGTQLQSFVPYAGLSGPVFLAFGKEFTDAYAAGALPQTIPDLATMTVDIVLPAGAGIVRDLDVFLGIEHTFDGDLDVTLTHLTTGVTATLFTDIGGTSDGLLVNLSDEASTDIGTVPSVNGAYVAGSFRPEGSTTALAAFDGEDASGRWRLTVTDDTSADTGTLRSWELLFDV